MAAHRFYALDALRGLAIALMILVNTPGSWQHVYSPLLHAPWDGFTFADLVFPAFLFVVGAAMFYALRRSQPDAATFSRIAKRSALLVLIGIALNAFPFQHSLADWRLPGVLQRIGLCYGIAATLVLVINRRYLPVLAVALLLVYWLLLQLGSAQPYSLQHNLARQLDLALLGANHLYQGFGIAFDPEGVLSTLPAVVSVLLGYYAAQQLSGRSAAAGAVWLLNAGTILLLLAWLSSQFWPVNKALWSGSYVLLSTGLLLWLLAFMLWLADIKGRRALLQPLVTYGSNPLFIYVLSWLWAVTLGLLPVGDSNLSQTLFMLLGQLLPLKLASLVFALAHVVMFWWLSRVLYRRNIIIRL